MTLLYSLIKVHNCIMSPAMSGAFLSYAFSKEVFVFFVDGNRSSGPKFSSFDSVFIKKLVCYPFPSSVELVGIPSSLFVEKCICLICSQFAQF